MSGIPNFSQVTVGVETAFGTNSAAHRILPVHEWTRFNRSLALMDDAEKLRGNLGPTAGVVGVDAVQDLTIKHWAQSGITPITGTAGAWTGVMKEMYEGIPGVGTGKSTSTKGFATIAGSSEAGGVTILELTNEATNIASYQVGSTITVITNTGVKYIAVITAKLANVGTPANLDLTLDRTITFGTSIPASITGAYCLPIDPQGGSAAHGLVTGDDYQSVSIEQTDLNGITDRALGCCMTGYSLYSDASSDGTSHLWEEFTFKVNAVEVAVTAASSPTAAPAYNPITVHDWSVIINKTAITNIISVRFDYECEVSERMDISASTGRSGMVVTSVNPKITIVALKDSNWTSLAAWFAARTEVPVSVGYSPNSSPTAGDLIGLYAPKCVVLDPYNVEDGDTQTITMEFVCLYDDTNDYSAVLSIA